jgi:hypothetical protein
VARVAYELYLRRGGEGGHDVEDWFAAERLLQNLNGRKNGSRELWVPRRMEDKTRV